MLRLSESPVPHAKDIALRYRVLAYLAMLSGYLFYNYNYLVVSYVRPHLISDFGMSLLNTAQLSVTQSAFVTLGALVAAPAIARFGRRKSLFVAAFMMGAMAVVCANTHGFAGWFTAQSIMAVVMATYYVAGINLIVALFAPEHRAMLTAISSGLFSVAEIMLGGLGAALGSDHWIWIVWIGATPLILSPLILFFVPKDRTFIAYGAKAGPQLSSGGWREMLSPRWRRYTLSCAILAGLNFMGYSIFSGFVTLYLHQDRHFAAADVGATFAVIGAGSLIGGFFWALIADRFGRKLNCIGFLGTALFIVLFLIAPRERWVLEVCGFGYGFCVSCTYCWGVWFTEMFPLRLRPYGAALFHAGHLIAWSAPLIAAWTAETWNLATAMALGPVIFLLGAGVWLTLPETIKASPVFRGWDPEAA